MRESTLVAKAVLADIVEKLESDKHLLQRMLSATPGGFFDPAKERIDKDTQRNSATGLLHLRSAYLDATRALASHDAEQIELASPHCEKLFSDGRMLLQK